MSSTIRITLPLLVLLCLGSPAAVQGQEILRNGDAEFGDLTGWEPGWGSSMPQVDAVTAQNSGIGWVYPQEGSFFFSFAVVPGNTASIYQSGTVEQEWGEMLTLTGQFMTEDYTAMETARVRLFIYDGPAGALLASATTGFMTTSNNAWEPFSLDLQIPDSAQYYEVHLMGFQDGGEFINVYYDDVQILTPPSDPPIPIMDPEPTFTAGESNTVSWSDESMSGILAYTAMCAEDQAFTTGLQYAPSVTETEHTFTGLTNGQIYYYRVRSMDLYSASDWSAAVSSSQDDTPPESSADWLYPRQATQSWNVPYTATDDASGVAEVELYWGRYIPGVADFGWEGGFASHLGQDGGHSPMTITNTTERAHTGSRCLRLEHHGGHPQVYLSWIRNLAEGDTVRAGFWRYDDTPGEHPSCRIDAHWNDDLSGDYLANHGDAGGSSDDGPGTGWDYTEYGWVVPEGHRGLMVCAKVRREDGHVVWIDDLHVEAPLHAGIMLPDTSVAGYSYHGTFASSPIPFTAQGFGTYNFYTRALDNVGNYEMPPSVLPDAWTLYSDDFSAAPEALPGQPEFRLYCCAPNPFNPATTIRYDLDRTYQVVLSVYDLQGRQVCALYSGEQPAGNHEVIWRGQDDTGQLVASGLYFCSLAAGPHLQNRPMVLVR